MDAERWARIEALFLRAVESTPGARRALLDDERARDPEAVERVERLLTKDEEETDGWLGALERGATDLQTGEALVGREIGAYRLVERIAAGGMGVVYRAERTDGLFEHAVAVKLIRGERPDSEALRRFDRERRALAALHHPNIARLFDGGTTEDGRPFLVMEIVDGVPIDRYCDERRLTVSQRIELLVTVATAVHDAHRSLVVHRDLKPGNVLIDASGAPKLLDFGIAKLLDDERDASEATWTLSRALTPEYASPEQLTGGPVTTAIDVYSLGVLLYELVTGVRPFTRAGTSPMGWQRDVVERSPERPSEAVARAGGRPHARSPEDVAAWRRTTPSGLRRRLEGDVDRIVLMAMRKEPERRYPSAQALAEDLERHLAGQPVRARGDSFLYRATKFVRRNRIEVAAIGLGMVAIIGALVATRRSEREARANEEHARIEAESSEGMAEFVMDTFLTSNLAEDEARVALARDRVRLHADRVRRQYPDSAHVRANLLDGLGRVALRLDDHEHAEELLHEALALREATFGDRSLEYALSLRSVAHLLIDLGEVERAAEHLEEALDLHRSLDAGTHTDVATVANDLAVCLRRLNRVEAAEALHRECLALRRAAGPRTLPVAESLNNLAGIYLDRGDLEGARELLAEALEIRREVLSSRHPLTLQSMANLAIPTFRCGDREGALALLEKAADGYRALRTDGAEGLARSLSNLGAMQIVVGRLTAAERNLHEALELELERVGEDYPTVVSLRSKLAALAQTRHETAGAEGNQDEEGDPTPSSP